MFTTMQTLQLGDKLQGEHVKTRKQGGAQVSYLEGHTAIAAANRIFGYGCWETKIMSLTCEEKTEVSNTNGKQGWRVGHLCMLEVTVYNADRSVAVKYQDVGFGSGTDYSSLGGAVESSTKEAMTDALKRCLRYLGNQFGLALYDKDQTDVLVAGGFDAGDAQRRILAHPAVTIEEIREAMAVDTYDTLKAIYKRVADRGKTLGGN
jgi:DNA repair and recombination protein RAD52